MRESLNSLVVIVLVVFYCFATDITGNSPKFYGIVDKPEFNAVSFIQTINTNSFFYLAQKENTVSETFQLPVSEAKKIFSKFVCSLNPTDHVLEPKEFRHKTVLSFPLVSSKVFLIIFPFNYFW